MTVEKMTTREVETNPGVRRLPIVGVMGSGVDEHRALAEPLGELLARAGVHLLTGGGGGVMASVARAFTRVPARLGLSIGVLPAASPSEPTRPRDGYPNEWVELPVCTHLPLSGEQGLDPLSRNHVNVLTPDLVIALPGGAGTRSEVELAIGYRRAVVAVVPEGGERRGLPDGVEVLEGVSAIEPRVRALYSPST